VRLCPSRGAALTDTPAEVAPQTALEREAESWVAGYFNARHLLRTRDWVVALDPSAGPELRIAALTHDIERHVPGGPRLDPRTQPWDDPDYLREHSRRSAGIVSAWLERQDKAPSFRRRVEELIARHEVGGTPEGDLLQAADSLSFLEVNAGRARAWVAEGRCDASQAQLKLDWMRDRIAVDRAAEPAKRLHALATAALGEPSERGGGGPISSPARPR
jgi:hypothetical protein